MLITCDGCGAKMRAPDSAAGKRVKCPKCAHIVTVPALDKSKDDAEDTKVSATPMPPPAAEEEPLDDDEKTKVTSSGAKPPRIMPKSADSIADEDDEDDRPLHKRRRMDEDEDDYLDVRSDRRPKSRANNLATTAMTLGIVSLVMSTGGICCCGIFGAVIAIICGGLALVFGYMGRGPGSDGAAMTGMICGGIGLALGLMMLVLIIFVIGFDIAGQQGMFNFNPNG